MNRTFAESRATVIDNTKRTVARLSAKVLVKFNLLSFMSIVSSLFGIFSCGTTQTIKEGGFREQPYRLQSTEYKGFSTNRFERSFKLGKLPSVEINALTTDWGPPYSDDVYGSAPFVYTARNRLPYSNEPDNAVKHANTMIYLSSKRFTKSAFDEYVAFMEKEWPAIDSAYARDPYGDFPHIIGLVYGQQADFVKIFRGKLDGKEKIVKVEIDGRIAYKDDKPSGANNDYSGLSVKVQMPGKIIYLDTKEPSAITLAQLRTYKDDKGKTIDDYFTVLPQPVKNK